MNNPRIPLAVYLLARSAHINAAMAARSSSNPGQQLLEVNQSYSNGGR